MFGELTEEAGMAVCYEENPKALNNNGSSGPQQGISA